MLLVSASAAYAQDHPGSEFPTRTITLVVPFGAGGPPDSIARVVASGLEKRLGKPVIVENRTGASSAIAAAAVARAEPDGHTLLAVDISLAVAPHVVSTFGVDPLKDFKAVGQTAKSAFTLITSAALPAQTLDEFIKLTREKRDGIMIGHTGIGTTPHLAAVTFANAAKVDPLLVSYRAIGDATNNVMAGLISGVFSAASTAVGASGTNKVRVLGVTGDKRLESLPDVPTFTESGIAMKGFEGGSWYGIVAPAGTPDTVVAKLNGALNEAVRDKALRERLAAGGIELTSGTPKAFYDFIATQHAFWGETLRAAGVRPEAK